MAAADPGRAARAETAAAVARSITEPFQQAQALTGVARAAPKVLGGAAAGVPDGRQEVAAGRPGGGVSARWRMMSLECRGVVPAMIAVIGHVVAVW
ncbi:MAG TPA: hypothetical protein VFW65_02885 [Pseudonocardiaceae bacterium]|nr:hypothetical protein [Pseudonocardiaceae bacterium]